MKVTLAIKIPKYFAITLIPIPLKQRSLSGSKMLAYIQKSLQIIYIQLLYQKISLQAMGITSAQSDLRVSKNTNYYSKSFTENIISSDQQRH